MADEVLKILEELTKDAFEQFRFYLKVGLLEGCRPIPPSQLEGKSRTDVVTLMKHYYGDQRVKITLEILKKIGRNDLVERLEDNAEKTQAEATALHHREQEPSGLGSAPVHSSITAQAGASVVAPQLLGCHFEETDVTVNTRSEKKGALMTGEVLNILDNLRKEEFEKFRFYLTVGVLEGCKGIPYGRLEGKNRIDVVTLMKSYYGDQIMKITLEILKKIGLNYLIERLEDSAEKSAFMAGEVLKILGELRKDEFEKFRFYLMDEVPEGCRCIPRSQLQGRSWPDVVTLMKSYYGDQRVKITLGILKKIGRNDLIESLEDNAEKTQAEATALHHREREPSDLGSAPVHSSITAQAGASVVAPQLLGCHFEETDITVNTRSENKDAPIKRDQLALKTQLKKKFEFIYQGFTKPAHPTLLNQVYIGLNITLGVSRIVNNEHEVIHIEVGSKRNTTQETAILCTDIFRPLPGEQKPRTVLTKGIAGIGKTISVQKFILDWAEGKANQDIDFIFPLPFRHLNLMKEKEISLMQLLQLFFPQLKNMENIESDQVNVVFILDGLDECQLPLDFENRKFCFDITEQSPVDVLLTNIIQGNLLPFALLWITSRPSAACRIPQEFLHRVTGIKGFNDPQKEEYLRKLIKDQNLARRIIAHIELSRSLYIMCHIPVFGWICATVLEKMSNEEAGRELPKNLTEIYTHYMLFQMKSSLQKYVCTEKTTMLKNTMLKLGKLAFLQLQKGNLIFYEKDLRESGLTEASVYSAVCTEVFREEYLLYQKVYCFVHLSIQEYLAALFVHHSCVNEKRNVLGAQGITMQLSTLHRTAVDQALESKNGHLDLFLRFLLGLSVDSIETLVSELLIQRRRYHIRKQLPQTESRSESNEKTVQYIKEKIREESSPERTINLFHCLNELNDCSLVRDIQLSLRTGKLSEKKLEPHECSGVAFVLLMSEEILDEFDLKTYNTSAEGRQRLVPVIMNCRKAVLNSCDFTEKSYDIVTSVLSSSSPLKELDLGCNNLGESAVELLCAGLMSPNCKLQSLGLNSCDLTEKSCEIVASALQSSDSPLRDLDLSYNNLGDSGVELLCAGLKTPNCKLQSLGLKSCDLTEKSCEIVASVLQSSNSTLRDLDLSCNSLGVSGVELLCTGLISPNCELQRLGLGWCYLTEGSCDVLASVLRSPHSKLRDLELRDNELQDSGVRALSAGLGDPHCQLQRLGLSGCGVTQSGCDSLASALSSNPSHLRELDLTYNHPGDGGVRALSAAKLDTLTLRVDHGGEHRTKPGPRKYGCQLTLDPNTANEGLSLSDGNRKVAHTPGREVPYPDHPERFEDVLQVVSRESVCERCYWEAEYSVPDGGWVCVAVTYEGIGRKGEGLDCAFGWNTNSWSLECEKHSYSDKHSYSFRHNKNQTVIPTPTSPYSRVGQCADDDGGECVYRLGVFVDQPAGFLSFYSVSDSDTLTLLHRFHTHVAEHTPLCAGFGVQSSSLFLCQLE